MQVDLPRGTLFADIRGSGTPVLILHGGGLDHRHMVETCEPVFADASGWQRIYLDLPGHGRSTVDDSIATQDDVLGLIEGFLDQVLEGSPFAVIGESRGSYHAMALAARHPSRVLGAMLVVADAMPGLGVDHRPVHQTLHPDPDAAERASPEGRERFGRLVIQGADILDKIERFRVPATALADAALAKRLKQAFTFSFDMTPSGQPVDVPCLIINGRQDAMAGYRDMLDILEHFPRATLAVLDGAGHCLAWERPDLFTALTHDWLVRVSAHHA